MAIFIQLARLTEKAHQNIRHLDEMLGEINQLVELNGAHILHAYVTLGEYDMIAVVEAPDEKAAARLSALIANQGHFRAETLSAIPLQEFLNSMR